MLVPIVWLVFVNWVPMIQVAFVQCVSSFQQTNLEFEHDMLQGAGP